MLETKHIARTRAQESTNAIEKLYISMRHLLSRGFYKPMGISGETLRKSLLLLRPEIYGSIAEERIELNGLVYIIERLPEGIEECQFINLTADEGYRDSQFKAIIPPKRRRNCYRIDKDQMNIEITRGRSEIYDILTHLTFLFIESHKIIQDNDIFSEALFSTHSDLFLPYVLEVKNKTNELSRLLRAGKKSLAHSRLLIIEQQISALRTALNSNSVVHKAADQHLVAIKARRYKKAAQAVMQASHNLHNKLNETVEFERRLLAMINEREQLRQRASIKKSDQLSEEVLALHQRLGRCRQAISKLEREIAQTKRF